MVRPIEIADQIAKTPAAERINQLEKAAPEMDQRQFAIQLRKDALQRQQAVSQSEKTDEVIIHREKPHEEKKQKKDKDRKKKDQGDIHLNLTA